MGDKPTQQIANDFPIAIFQYKYDTSFAHINFISHKAGKEIKKAKGVTQLITLMLEKPCWVILNFLQIIKQMRKKL